MDHRAGRTHPLTLKLNPDPLDPTSPIHEEYMEEDRPRAWTISWVRTSRMPPTGRRGGEREEAVEEIRVSQG